MKNIFSSIIVLFTILGTINLSAQNDYIDGPSTVNKGEIHNFSYDPVAPPYYNLDVTTVLWTSQYCIIQGFTGGDNVDVDFSWLMPALVRIDFEDYLGVAYWDDIFVFVQDPVTPPDPFWYYDGDGDGFGDPAVSLQQATQPPNYVSNNTDACPNSYDIIDGCPPYSLSDENYVYTISPTVNMTNEDLSLLNNGEKIESVTYFDGLGRPKQNIGIRAGGQSQDIIIHITYDKFGRQVKDYLPYSELNNNGFYMSNANSKTSSFYNTTKYENTYNPYSNKLYEESPLGRVLKQAAPGYDWRLYGNNEIEFGYESNLATEVKRYKVSLSLSISSNTYTYIPTLEANGNYAVNELYKSIVKDENHDGTSAKDHTMEEFKDKQGRVILKRTYNNEIKHDTYYVYDDFGNLSYVLPPLADADVNIPSVTELNDLCYQYIYDDRNRLVEKKIPGKGKEYIVYNKLDQPILTQDAVLDAQNKWLFTKYDAFGRVAYTGETSNMSHRTFLQSTVDGISSQWVTKSSSPITIDGTTIYYNNGAYPTSISEIYSINYYDDYTFDGFSNLPSSIDGQTVVNYNNNSKSLTKGLVTGSKVRILDTDNWITTIIGYDTKGRSIYTTSNNTFLGTTDIVKNSLDFVGNVNKAITTHTKSGTSIITEDLLTYDHMGRIDKQTQELNNTNVIETILDNTYDELGQLESKGVGGTSNRLQTVNYSYNIRGWLKEINEVSSIGTDLFAFKINYNSEELSSTQSIPLYNGNIAETIWRTASDISSNKTRGYAYKYDDLNRITYADYGIKTTGSYGLSSGYDMEVTNYDKNGNIKGLWRDGSTNGVKIDNLSYNYLISERSNQLQRVNDSSGNNTDGFNNGTSLTTEYTYDTNGNMVTDTNKGITVITYNHLNLPTKVTFSGSNKYIDYFYDATGIKQKKQVTNSSTVTETFYAGNYIYEGSSLKFFNHAEGFVKHNNGTFEYVYQYKDHLGNIRLNYKDLNQNNASAISLEIQEENHYYPFGLKHKGYGAGTLSEHDWKYNGVEFENDDVGGNKLNLYSMDFRQYDPAIARFTGIDPVTHHYQSTYTAFDNNPIFYADPSGTSSQTWNSGDAGFAQAWETIKQDSKLWQYDDEEDDEEEKKVNGTVIAGEVGLVGSDGDCTDCTVCPETCNKGEKSKINMLSLIEKDPENQDFTGFGGGLYYIWTGGNIDGFRYNSVGQLVGLSPLMSEPVFGGPAKGVSWVNKMLRKYPDALVKIEQIGEKYWKYSVNVPGKGVGHVGRTVYSKYLNPQGKTMKWFHDTYNSSEKWLHRGWTQGEQKIKLWWDGVKVIK